MINNFHAAPGVNQDLIQLSQAVVAGYSALSFRQTPQPGRSIVSEIATARLVRGFRVEEQFPVFRHEEEQEPIDDTEQLAIVVLRGERA